MNKFTRKRTRKEAFLDGFFSVLGWIIFPFYHAYVGIMKAINWLLWDRIRTGDNGIIGPGFHSYYTTKFAWGKLTFFVVILFIISYFIFLR